ESGKALKPSFYIFWLFSSFFRILDCLGQLLAEAAFRKSCSWDKLSQTGPK
ncbi:Os02g0211100, partial [Oryza sativa Japonica Group]